MSSQWCECCEASARELAAEREARERAERELAVAHAAILWALGCNGEWPERKPGDGAFYWRSTLRMRAGITVDELSRAVEGKEQP